MCSNFCQDMDHYHGDLADIVRASGSVLGGSTPSITTTTDAQMRQWQFGSSNPATSGSTNHLQYQLKDLYPFSDHLLLGDTERGYGFMSSAGMMSINASCSSPKDGFVEGTTGVQIPSPRNPGIKRRKSQAKKVVCIPAPAPANSRQSGEVVPSDLWAWRKYGQKPIKGSPYPRGYYRCSSSKGCSARKQVERSRTDPNMLVITYTSEHNHPWPTQRNALAGSTRSQPSKPTTTTTTNVVRVKEELMNNNKEGSTSTTTSSMKEEEVRTDEATQLQVENNKLEEIVQGPDDNDNGDYDQFNNNGYRPIVMAEHSGQQQQLDQDFFADLVEFEGDDPLNLLFNQENKSLDAFSGLFYWPPNNVITTTTTETTDVQSNDHS